MDAATLKAWMAGTSPAMMIAKERAAWSSADRAVEVDDAGRAAAIFAPFQPTRQPHAEQNRSRDQKWCGEYQPSNRRSRTWSFAQPPERTPPTTQPVRTPSRWRCGRRLRTRRRTWPRSTRGWRSHSAPAVTSARLVGALAPVTVKLPLGIAWNAALTVRSLEWSLAQAARPRSAMIVPSRSANWVWNHEPSSVRVAVTDLPA